MIGDLPGTLQDRSIVVRLRRKAPGERVEKIPVDFRDELQAIRQKCMRWSSDNFEKLKTVKAEIPDTGNDRQADNWFPLFCIAHVCGGEWPDLVKNSMIGNSDADEDSITTLLLSDIRDILKHSEEKIFSDSLCDRLKNIEDHPWCERNRGKGLTQNGLARLLKPFGIYSSTVRIGTERRKGYSKDSFGDAFSRYLLSPDTPFQTVTTSPASNHECFSDFQTVTQADNVTDEKTSKPLSIKDCHDVTDKNGVSWKDIEEIL